jgi:DNA-binding IclR family transcriptional regulator
MKNRKVIRILELLQTEHAQSLTKTEMANELNMHYNTFKKYINILLDLKLVKKHGKKQYQIDAKTHKKIINAINH